MKNEASITSSMEREVLVLIHQYLKENGLKETAHKLESESRLFFDEDYFESLIRNDKYGRKLFFEMRKQKLLEALNRKDRLAAYDILFKELKVFEDTPSVWNELLSLPTLDDFRQLEVLSHYDTDANMRNVLADSLKKIWNNHPVLKTLLQLPSVQEGRLKTLLSQSVNYQTNSCKNCRESKCHPLITLFKDHQPQDDHKPLSNQNTPSAKKTAVNDDTTILDPSPVVDSKRRSPNTSAAKKTESENTNGKRTRDQPTPAEVAKKTKISAPLLEPSSTPEELPTKMMTRIVSNSVVTAIRFHPINPALLLVGTIDGLVQLYDVSENKLLHSVEGIRYGVSRLIWSEDGNYVGASTKSPSIRVYKHNAKNALELAQIINLHTAEVTDISFCIYRSKLHLVSCSNDRTIQVFNAASGNLVQKWEDADGQMLAVTTNRKADLAFVCSSSATGKVKVWLFNEAKPVLELQVSSPCHQIEFVENRVFLGGRNQLVEWDVESGSQKRSYAEVVNALNAVLHFDICKHHNVIALGDGKLLKFWNMDNAKVLRSTLLDAAIHRVAFSSKGEMLAVMYDPDSPKSMNVAILVNPKLISNKANAVLLKRSTPDSTQVTSPVPIRSNSSPVVKRKINFTTDPKVENVTDAKPNGESALKCITVSSQQTALLTLTNQHDGPVAKVLCAKSAKNTLIISLGLDGHNKVWNWTVGSMDTQPELSNDFTIPRIEDTKRRVYPCLVAANNNAVVVSGLGNELTVYNICAKTDLATIYGPKAVDSPKCMPTTLAIHPHDNNAFAVGSEHDNTIRIYSVHTFQENAVLVGHTKTVTCLYFGSQNCIISGGEDSQLIVWDIDATITALVGEQKKPVKEYSEKSHRSLLLNEKHGGIISLSVFNRLVLVAQKDVLSFVETDRLKIIAEFVNPYSCSFVEAAFTSSGSHVVCALQDGRIVILKTDLDAANQINVKEDRMIVLPNTIIATCLSTSPSVNNQFVIGCTDGYTRVVAF